MPLKPEEKKYHKSGIFRILEKNLNLCMEKFKAVKFYSIILDTDIQ